MQSLEKASLTSALLSLKCIHISILETADSLPRSQEDVRCSPATAGDCWLYIDHCQAQDRHMTDAHRHGARQVATLELSTANLSAFQELYKLQLICLFFSKLFLEAILINHGSISHHASLYFT
jgi:hypothetical protein